MLARGKVWITGVRSDVVGDFLADRIEGLVAAAKWRLFYLDGSNTIKTYNPSDGAELRTGALYIDFWNVRVHWPSLVAALQEAGFEISVTPEQAEVRNRGTSRTPGLTAQEPLSSVPEEGDKLDYVPANRRGPPPELRLRLESQMIKDIKNNAITVEDLATMKQEALATRYGAKSRSTAVLARKNVLENSDITPTKPRPSTNSDMD